MQSKKTNIPNLVKEYEKWINMKWRVHEDDVEDLFYIMSLRDDLQSI